MPASANSVAQASERVELAEGHTDLIEVTLDAGKLRIQVKDDTKPGGAVFRDPSNVQVRVRDASKISSPAGDQFSFLGAPGTPLYLLPQVQAPNLLWPGWSTERLSTGQVAGDKVTVTMSSFSGPGKLVMFTTNQFGAPNVIFHSGIAGKNKMDVAARVHAHASWAFDQAGEYRMGITATATLPNGTPLTATVTYVMLVGDATPLAPWDTTTTTGPGQTTTAPTTTRPAGVGTAPTTTIASRAPSGSTNSSGGSTEAGAADTSVRGANQTAGGSDPALARTGNDAAVLLRWAAISTAAGICLLAAKRRRTRALPVVVTTRTESSSQ